jgi:hypothetical protein
MAAVPWLKAVCTTTSFDGAGVGPGRGLTTGGVGAGGVGGGV